MASVPMSWGGACGPRGRQRESEHKGEDRDSPHQKIQRSVLTQSGTVMPACLSWKVTS